MLPQNKNGFTLVEVLVAMLITLVALLGLLQSVNIMTEQNLRNAVREEEMKIAEQYMSNIRLIPFDNLPKDPDSNTYNYPELNEQCRYRGTSASYKINRILEWKSGDTTVLITVTVSLPYKDALITQSLSTVKSN